MVEYSLAKAGVEGSSPVRDNRSVLLSLALFCSSIKRVRSVRAS